MRYQVQVRLSEEARRGWDRLATEHGTTMTALIEAIGLELHEGRMPLPQVVIDLARRIDFDRRSRR